jgi:hypothetical protein
MALSTNVSADMLLFLSDLHDWALMQPPFDMQLVSLQLALNQQQQRPLQP